MIPAIRRNNGFTTAGDPPLLQSGGQCQRYQPQPVDVSNPGVDMRGERIQTAWHPTDADRAIVRAAYADGIDRAAIAERLNISVDMFDRHRTAGSFGPLPSRQGCRGGGRRRRPTDDEHHVFGLHTNEWNARRVDIQRGWTPAERDARSRGILPNDRLKQPGERYGREAGRAISTRRVLHRRDW